MPEQAFKVVGHSEQRIGAVERLSGECRFAADIDMESVVALQVLRSDRPHARIVRLDTSDSRRVPGCLAVFTASDIPGRNRLGIIKKDQRLLADGKVRCIGDAVALVAAETLTAAEEAIEAVRVVTRIFLRSSIRRRLLNPAQP